MKRLVQDGTDIDAIVLAGGGAFFFGEAIARAYLLTIGLSYEQVIRGERPVPGPFHLRARPAHPQRRLERCAERISRSCLHLCRAPTASRFRTPRASIVISIKNTCKTSAKSARV
jgi:hypothetical protein